MIEARFGNVNVGIGDVLPVGEEGWVFCPIEEVCGCCEAEARGGEVVACVCEVEGSIHADYVWVFGPSFCFPGCGGGEDWAI